MLLFVFARRFLVGATWRVTPEQFSLGLLVAAPTLLTGRFGSQSSLLSAERWCCALLRSLVVSQTLKVKPAMAAGVSQTLWSMDDLCEKMDAVAPKPGKRSPLEKSVAA